VETDTESGKGQESVRTGSLGGGASGWPEHYRKELARWSNTLLVAALVCVGGAILGPAVVHRVFQSGELGVRFGFVVSPCLVVIALACLTGALLTRRAARRAGRSQS
jgi:hypothetical protein